MIDEMIDELSNFGDEVTDLCRVDDVSRASTSLAVAMHFRSGNEFAGVYSGHGHGDYFG